METRRSSPLMTFNNGFGIMMLAWSFLSPVQASPNVVLTLPSDWQAMNEEVTSARRRVDFLKQSESLENYQQMISQTTWIHMNHAQQDKILEDEKKQLTQKNCHLIPSKDSKLQILYECKQSGWSGLEMFFPVDQSTFQSVSYQIKEFPLSNKTRMELVNFLSTRAFICESTDPDDCMRKMKSAKARSSSIPRHTK